MYNLRTTWSWVSVWLPAWGKESRPLMLCLVLPHNNIFGVGTMTKHCETMWVFNKYCIHLSHLIWPEFRLLLFVYCVCCPEWWLYFLNTTTDDEMRKTRKKQVILYKVSSKCIHTNIVSFISNSYHFFSHMYPKWIDCLTVYFSAHYLGAKKLWMREEKMCFLPHVASRLEPEEPLSRLAQALALPWSLERWTWRLALWLFCHHLGSGQAGWIVALARSPTWTPAMKEKQYVWTSQVTLFKSTSPKVNICNTMKWNTNG